MVHLLKIKPEYFRAVDNGKKTFEIRKNDRDYRVGDYIVLREWNGEEYTGKMVCGKITYMLLPPANEFVAEGYIAFSFGKVHPINIVKDLRQTPELYKDKVEIYEFVLDHLPQM